MHDDVSGPDGVIPRTSDAPPSNKPGLRSDVVRRTRLIERLSSRPFRLALVSAPAGFGKTTLVLDWIRSCSAPHIWIALSETENDPHRFFTRIASELESLGAPSRRIREALGSKAPPNVLEARLLDDLNEVASDLVLVLDDYQYIETPELHRFVSHLPDILPLFVRLVIVSRFDPPFSLAKLRLNGDFVEIRQHDLRFTQEETLTFFDRTIGLALNASDARALESRTEGWIAGLQMAAISLRNEPDVPTFVRTFSGSNVYIVDYLLEEVIQRQTPEVQRFLIRTSILSRFDARLCAAVTGVKEADRLLAEVEAANLFLVSLDRERGWYRYHHLFAELLASRLYRSHPEEWDDLHLRASKWCESVGDVDGALHYARRISTRQRLVALLERNAYQMLDRSELGAFSEWASSVTTEEACGYPMFLIARGWVHLLTERVADIDALLDLADEAIERPRVPYSDLERHAFREMTAVLRAYAFRLRGDHETSIRLTTSALSNTDSRDARTRGLLYFNLGRSQAFIGETDAACESFDRAFDSTLQSRTWYLVFGSSAHRVSLMMQREGLAPSLERIRASLAFARARHQDDLPATGYLYCQLGTILLLQGELDDAEEAFKLARDRGSSGHVYDVLRNALIGLVRVYGARRKWQIALEILMEFGVVGHASNPLQLDTSYEIERARLALLAGDLEQLDAWCTTQVALPSEPFTTLRETAALLLIQALLNRGELEQAASAMTWLDGEAIRRGRRLTSLEVQIGRAVLLSARGSDDALRVLDGILRNAALHKFVLPFRQYGEPVRVLLEHALEGHLSDPAAAHARLILDGESTARPEPSPMFRQPLAAPLTEREQEVLYHLSRHLSYQAIADALFVSHDTIKTHVKHIYTKLDATSRPEAIARARQVGLILADAPTPCS